MGEAEFDMIVTANAATALIKILRQRPQERPRGRAIPPEGQAVDAARHAAHSIPFDETGTLPIGSIIGKKGSKAD